MPLRKLKVLFLFLLHLLSPLQLPVLFPTCSFLFLASSSHVLTSAFMVYLMQARTLKNITILHTNYLSYLGLLPNLIKSRAQIAYGGANKTARLKAGFRTISSTLSTLVSLKTVYIPTIATDKTTTVSIIITGQCDLGNTCGSFS